MEQEHSPVAPGRPRLGETPGPAPPLGLPGTRAAAIKNSEAQTQVIVKGNFVGGPGRSIGRRGEGGAVARGAAPDEA